MSVTSDTITTADVSTAMPGDYFELLKPRVMSLVVFTALVGMCAAPSILSLPLAAIALLAIAMGAGASGALNMWYDAAIDAKMSRTRHRPIPAGLVKPNEALVFGLVLSAFSVVVLGLFANWLAAALLAFTIFFYAVIYTMWLKRSTPQNIVIGGAAGALPPVVGWAAMTGSVGLEPWIMFAIIFLWTPPHFWALALLKSADYARAGIPMMPNIAGDQSTRRQILVYSVLTAIAGVLPWLLQFAGVYYGLVAIVLGLGFVRQAYIVFRAGTGEKSNRAARQLFAYSIVYLFALFSALLVDSIWSMG